jgi:hypothetical protein
MNKEEILNKIKDKVDTLSSRAYELLNNGDGKFTKDDFVMYCDVHNLFRNLDKLIERKNDIYIDFSMKYLNCMDLVQQNKVKEFIDVSNGVRSLLEDPSFIEEKEKILTDYIVIPGSYAETNMIPNLPEGAKSYFAQFGNASSATYVKYEAKAEDKLPFGNNEAIYNIVNSKLNKDTKLLGVGFGTTAINKYKYTYYLTATIPMTLFSSLSLQIEFQFEIEGKILEVSCVNSDMMSKRIMDIKSIPDNITMENDALLDKALNEELDSNYPDDAVCRFRKLFKDIIDNN